MSVEHDLPTYCSTLSPEEKSAWMAENDKLDQFYTTLDSAELKLSTSNPEDFNMLKIDANCPDFKEYLLHRNGSEYGMDFFLRFELYNRLKVFDRSENCNNISTVMEHCNCMNNLRMDMTGWLVECMISE